MNGRRRGGRGEAGRRWSTREGFPLQPAGGENGDKSDLEDNQKANHETSSGLQVLTAANAAP